MPSCPKTCRLKLYTDRSDSAQIRIKAFAPPIDPERFKVPGRGQLWQMNFRTFSYRLNRDGTYDAICVECFRTIATHRSEADLKRKEELHQCDPFLLDLLWGEKTYFR